MDFASLDLVRSALRATAAPPAPARAGEGPIARPTVTISRSGGIDVSGLVTSLADNLNRAVPGEPKWIGYDRSLVERVAADHEIAHDLVASLDERDKTWFEHLTAGLTGTATGTDVAMKTAQTIRALSRIGHAIVVGRGGQCILADVPHVVHVRLYAPVSWRAARHAEAHGGTEAEAEEAVQAVDQERGRFIRSHFHRDVTDQALYDVALNVARVPEPSVVMVIAALVRSHVTA